MKRLICLGLALLTSCATVDRSALYTEDGLRAGEAAWNRHYFDVLQGCQARFEAGTPEARACFEPTFKADRRVEPAVGAAVATLQVYWAARANGDRPPYTEIMRGIATIVDRLPPEVRTYFQRVKGLR